MTSKEKVLERIKELQNKMKAEMPRIQKEIEVYEFKQRQGKINQNPKPAPQFNV